MKTGNIYSYLTFSGNCREAMEFYKSCIGGELILQTIGDSPLSDKMPQEMKDCILHATLTRQEMTLMGSDIVGEHGLNKGNSVSLMYNCGSEEEIKRLYKQLGQGGRYDHPIELSFWGALFGDLTDKFGNHWLLHYQKDRSA